MEASTKMEFAVQMESSACEEEIRTALAGHDGIESVFIDVNNDLVLVQSVLTSACVQRMLEATGKLVLFRGLGSSTEIISPAAAVAIFNGEEVKGVVRLVQIDEKRCVVEGTIDGLQPGICQLRVREFGDLSQGYVSCGDVFSYNGAVPRAGELTSLQVNDTGRAEFHCSSEIVRVCDLIGRSLSIDYSSSATVCAIIARSSGLFQNSKRVCTCDGVTMWDEAMHNSSKTKL